MNLKPTANSKLDDQSYALMTVLVKLLALWAWFHVDRMFWHESPTAETDTSHVSSQAQERRCNTYLRLLRQAGETVPSGQMLTIVLTLKGEILKGMSGLNKISLMVCSCWTCKCFLRISLDSISLVDRPKEICLTIRRPGLAQRLLSFSLNLIAMLTKHHFFPSLYIAIHWLIGVENVLCNLSD